MEKSYFSLELHKSNKLTRIFQLAFGIVCFGVALVWLIINFSTLKSNVSLWITILFLAGFGYYQFIAGLGKSEKFIEISESSIKLKRNILFPSQELKSSDIDKIEVFPLNVVFFLKSGKTLFLRFGTTYTDVIEPVKKSIENFCNKNNINQEIRNEEL
jgi:energy-coupling factor transporter transmembrane protein EcfT